jgi:predicted O-methyltransferase YrrM
METSLETSLTSALSIASNAQSRLVKSSLSQDAALYNSRQQGIPPIAIGPAEGQYLSILCKLISAKQILEIGTLGGYSTLWFVDSVPGVKVTSIEINPKHRDVALENIKASPNAENADVILGAALDVLPALSTQGRVFDFVFIGKLPARKPDYLALTERVQTQIGTNKHNTSSGRSN